MNLHTFQARTIQEALARVRRELGPDAAVLHTREVGGPLRAFVPGLRRVEVTASADVRVPSRLGRMGESSVHRPALAATSAATWQPAAMDVEADVDSVAGRPIPTTPRAESPTDDVRLQLRELQTLVADLARQRPASDVPAPLARLHRKLLEQDLSEDWATRLVERVRAAASGQTPGGRTELLALAADALAEDLRVTGPIRPAPGERRLVALVGPTGVGKTTTLAKLAAHYRLRENMRVGLITVDTYRIAAVEQLRTYADIIDLPMQVVGAPREMRQAVERLSGLDLVLLDTAGRSPTDELRIQELKSLLREAEADEVHLVLASTASAGALARARERFSAIELSGLLLTKLDESSTLGGLLPLIEESRLPVSYLTDGQSVPEDIHAADPLALARRIVGLND